MGGRKHPMQGYGMPGKDLNKIKNPMERHVAHMSQVQYPNCKKCGKVLLPTSHNEKGQQIDWEFEHKVEMCTSCYAKHVEELRWLEHEAVKKMEAQKEEEWEELKKKYMRGGDD